MKTDRADVDLKSTSPLSTYGRHEEYINNKLWLSGVSSIILDGVGDGMIPWCALVKRIPIVCCYDREIHKSTIEAFLLEKIIKKMEAAIPGDTRWYRSAAQLGCRENDQEEPSASKSKAPGAKGKAATAKGKVTPAKRSAEDEAEESQESGEESASESKNKTSKKHKTTPVEKVD